MCGTSFTHQSMLANATASPRITGTRPIDRRIVTSNPARRSAAIIVRRSDKRTRCVSLERRSLPPTTPNGADVARQQRAFRPSAGDDGPIVPASGAGIERPMPRRLHEVEQKEAARIERARRTRKEPEHVAIVCRRAALSDKIIDDFSQRDDRAAARDRRRRERADRKPCPRRRAARKLHHRRRLVDAEDLEPMLGEIPRGYPAAASEFDHERTMAESRRESAAPFEKASDLGRGAARVLAEAGVVDVRQVESVDHSRRYSARKWTTFFRRAGAAAGPVMTDASQLFAICPSWTRFPTRVARRRARGARFGRRLASSSGRSCVATWPRRSPTDSKRRDCRRRQTSPA